ncbi:MAG: EamA family transporter [Nostocoides sp.]
MRTRDQGLALIVMVLWGMNFVVIDWGLSGVPPLVFVALRFSVVLLALPFVARPAASMPRILAVGLAMSAGQFGFMYTALAVGMPPGLASLVLQAQALFTTVIAVFALHERPLLLQLGGLGLGTVGLFVVGLGRGGAVPMMGLILTVAAALSWATGNVLVRYLKVPGGLGLTVWSALAVPIPMFALAAIVDSPVVVADALTHLSIINWLSTLYTAVLASLVGYGIWNSLLARYPASSVAPFSLLVPPVGMATAWVAYGEQPTLLAMFGGVLLVAGVAAVTVRSRRRITPALAKAT